MSEEEYVTIRDHLGCFIGAKILDVTQHDEDYFKRTGRSFVDLMLDSGDVVRFYLVGDVALCINPTDEVDAEAFGDNATN